MGWLEEGGWFRALEGGVVASILLCPQNFPEQEGAREGSRVGGSRFRLGQAAWIKAELALFWGTQCRALGVMRDRVFAGFRADGKTVWVRDPSQPGPHRGPLDPGQ